MLIPEPEVLLEEVVLVTVTLLMFIGWTEEDEPDVVDSWPLEDGEDIEEVVEDGEAFRPTPFPFPPIPEAALFNSRSNLSCTSG